MKVLCDYCRSYVDDHLEKCPYCGAALNAVERTVGKEPETIEDLKKWCEDRKLYPQKTRFFIGTNYTGARAFGIYKDDATGDYIVYKNKADGSRAIRYQGKDQGYAVHEIYAKLCDEITNQKNIYAEKKIRNAAQISRARNKNKKKRSHVVGWLAIIFVVFCIIYSQFSPSKDGYYSRNNDLYYRAGNDWYQYDTSYDDDDDDDGNYGWTYVSDYDIPDEFIGETWEDYKNTDDFSFDYNSFESTTFYDDWDNSSSSYFSSSYLDDDDYWDDDDDYSWDDDDWDWDDDDWDSDW